VIVGLSVAQNKKKSWQNKIAVITGASSGIGSATARKLASQGLTVVLVARRSDRLNQLASDIRLHGGRAEVIVADLSLESECQHVYNLVESEYGPADVLINNAGMGWYGYGTDMPWTIASEILRVNIDAVVHLTLLFLKSMHRLGTGHIVNIGSISGTLPSQGVAIYGATKSFLDNFTTALYRELAGTQLHVSIVRAGPVLTEFSDTAASLPGGLHLPAERIGVTADTIAGYVWKILQHPRRVVYVPGWLRITPSVDIWFGWLIDRLGPLLLRAQARQKAK
jgi:short-subunit dehydrogenase